MRKVELEVDGQGISTVTFFVNESIPDFVTNWFSDWISGYINAGAKFSNDQTIQYGWSLLKVELSAGFLKILGPDFQSMPISWTEDISRPLYTMMEQKYVAESFGAEFEICQLQNTLIVGTNFTTSPIVMRRYSPSEDNERDSGWFVGTLSDDVDNNDPDQLSLVSLYEASLKVPELVKFFWLPENYEVVLKGETFRVFFDGNRVKPEKGSYVSKKYNNAIKFVTGLWPFTGRP